GPVRHLSATRLRRALLGRHAVGTRPWPAGALHAGAAASGQPEADVLAAQSADARRGLYLQRLRHRRRFRGVRRPHQAPEGPAGALAAEGSAALGAAAVPPAVGGAAAVGPGSGPSGRIAALGGARSPGGHLPLRRVERLLLPLAG